MPIGNGEEDEAEEGVEGGAEKGQEITHTGHDLGEDERDGPNASHHSRPNTPADDGVAVAMSRVAHDTRVDKLSADIGVYDTDDQSRDDDEREGGLLVGDHAKTSECWGSGVLTKVAESNGGGMMNKKKEIAARTASDLGKSCGFSISEMKVGKRI